MLDFFFLSGNFFPAIVGKIWGNHRSCGCSELSNLNICSTSFLNERKLLEELSGEYGSILFSSAEDVVPLSCW